MARQEDTHISETTSTSPGQRRHDGEDISARPSQTARRTGQSVQGSAEKYVEQGRERVTSQLGDQKMRLTDELGSVSKAIRDAGQNLREQDKGQAARFVDQGAEQLDHFSQYLQNRDVNQLIGEAESFARQRPAIFVGGAFGLGLLASRFLKSSGQESRTPRNQ